MTSDAIVPESEDGLEQYVSPPPRPTEGNLARHAWDELDRAGWFVDGSDFYGGMTGRAVMELIETFSGQGHSGMSASIVIALFSELARFNPLSDLTDDPGEWIEVADGLWQNRRQGEAFSDDGGRTYRLNSDRDTVHTSTSCRG